VPAIERGRQDVVGCKLDQPGTDARCVVRLLRSDFASGEGETRRCADQGNQSGIFQKERRLIIIASLLASV
jgi:hypothetical protein